MRQTVNLKSFASHSRPPRSTLTPCGVRDAPMIEQLQFRVKHVGALVARETGQRVLLAVRVHQQLHAELAPANVAQIGELLRVGVRVAQVHHQRVLPAERVGAVLAGQRPLAEAAVRGLVGRQQLVVADLAVAQPVVSAQVRAQRVLVLLPQAALRALQPKRFAVLAGRMRFAQMRPQLWHATERGFAHVALIALDVLRSVRDARMPGQVVRVLGRKRAQWARVLAFAVRDSVVLQLLAALELLAAIAALVRCKWGNAQHLPFFSIDFLYSNIL